MITYFTAMRQRGRFAGFSVYVSNTTDRHSGYLCYKDGTALPPLDFNTNCITNGRYVIFYNERKDGITYPVGYETQSVYSELCEVYVLGMLKKCIFKKVIYNIRILFLFNKCFSSLWKTYHVGYETSIFYRIVWSRYSGIDIRIIFTYWYQYRQNIIWYKSFVRKQINVTKNFILWNSYMYSESVPYDTITLVYWVSHPCILGKYMYSSYIIHKQAVSLPSFLNKMQILFHFVDGLNTPMHCLHTNDMIAREKCTETTLNPNHLQIIGCNVQITEVMYLVKNVM